MSILINLSSTLRPLVKEYNPYTGLIRDYPVKQTCAQLAKALGIEPALIKLVMVNGRRYNMDDVIEDGDRVAFFPPLAVDSPARNRGFKIRRKILSRLMPWRKSGQSPRKILARWQLKLTQARLR